MKNHNLHFDSHMDESSDDFAQTSYSGSSKCLFFRSERILIDFKNKMHFGHILAVKVLLDEIGENKNLIFIEIVKNKAYKCPQLS